MASLHVVTEDQIELCACPSCGYHQVVLGWLNGCVLCARFVSGILEDTPDWLNHPSFDKFRGRMP